nr:tyrosyl-dna phosphodiesterase 1 [Quercus suber]
MNFGNNHLLHALHQRAHLTFELTIIRNLLVDPTAHCKRHRTSSHRGAYHRNDKPESATMKTLHDSPTEASPCTSKGIDQASTESGQAMSSLARLDRKAMEQERLSRIQKRQRSISPPGHRRKAPKLTETHINLPSGARLTTFTSLVDHDQAMRKSDAANVANEKLKSGEHRLLISERSTTNESSTAPGDLAYPRGIVKKTWAFKHERTGYEVKIEEVLEPSTLRTAVLSAFQWDMPWILSKLKTPDKKGVTKCVFIMQAKEQELRDKMLADTNEVRSFLRLCFPPMVGQTHCMHSKLMLLFHPKKLRIAIPTANLLNFDWGETGLMENSVFMIDLPRFSDGQKTASNDLSAFARELLYFLDKQGLDQDVRDGVANFDFSATRDLRFIHTVGGVSYKMACEHTGLCGLGKAVAELGMETTDNQIDFAASSIGSLTDEYLRSFQAATRGENMMLRAVKADTQAKADFFKPMVPKHLQPPLRPLSEDFRIYFPTSETVKASTAGAAGTICISRSYWESGKFPSNCFRDYRSTRTGLLSHNKILYVRGKRGNTASGVANDVAWAYVGSANMSESAWGKLVYDKKSKEWKINCRNWECGVLLPVSAARLESCKEVNPAERTNKASGEESKTESETSETESEAEDEKPDDAMVGMSVFDDLIKPPFEIPGRLYEGKEPWFFKE